MMTADILTKSIPKPEFQIHKNSLNLLVNL